MTITFEFSELSMGYRYTNSKQDERFSILLGESLLMEMKLLLERELENPFSLWQTKTISIIPGLQAVLLKLLIAQTMRV